MSVENQQPVQPVGVTHKPVARILLSGLPSALITAGGAALVNSWRADLPNPLASHWDAAGNPDRFGSIDSSIWQLVLFGALFTIVGVGVALLSPHSTVARFAAATGSGTAVFAVTLMGLVISGQRDLLDATEAEASMFSIVTALVVAVLIGVVSAMIVPRWATPHELAVGSEPTIALGRDERVVWTSGASVGPATAVLSVFGMGVIPVVAIALRMWWLLAVALVLVLALVALLSIRVIVDHRGVTVRSSVGWPRMTIPLDDIVSARVVQVRPIRDFGGYGFRFALRGDAAGAKGFVLRKGEALLVQRAGGGLDLVTVDDATTGAGVVNGLINRV